MRIVSLLPSATEIVCELGLGPQLVGVTHECDFPPHVSRLPKVTMTSIPPDVSSREIDVLVRQRLETQTALYNLDLPLLAHLRPDLIVTQALCDVCAVAEAEVNAAVYTLPRQPKVVNLEPTSLEDVFDCMQLVGEAAGIAAQARRTVARLRRRVEEVANRTRAIASPLRVVHLEWIDPPFSSGHWSPELSLLAGGRELVGQAGQRSRAMAWQEIVDADPEVIVIACCGFDLQRTRRDLPILASFPGFARLNCVRNDRIYLVDGNAYFNRPGPRLVDSLELLAHLLHPAIHPLPEGLPTPQKAAF